MVQVGEKAPDFELLDTTLKKRSLSEFLAKGRFVVLAFFPGAFTEVCTREMCTFRDRMARLDNLDAEVIGISVDSPFALRVFKEVNRLNFTLLSDYNREVIEKYGVVLPDLLGLGLKRLAKRALFIIDPKGVVVYKWVSEDPRVEPDYNEVERVLEKLKKGQTAK
ncbi:MAG TPA: peroxiredoxin [Sulfolobales archaeon]|nr:peroxiredoxin [Sulfolobales archaeon]